MFPWGRFLQTTRRLGRQVDMRIKRLPAYESGGRAQVSAFCAGSCLVQYQSPGYAWRSRLNTPGQDAESAKPFESHRSLLATRLGRTPAALVKIPASGTLGPRPSAKEACNCMGPFTFGTGTYLRTVILATGSGNGKWEMDAGSTEYAYVVYGHVAVGFSGPTTIPRI
ncbi:hypothetical protein F5Y01DRAFT_90070 [Xylaria sp. FL0043]|nr:hypothetical protein F5Y01DRAFT_90070 [Xylaria sp. FL0043]